MKKSNCLFIVLVCACLLQAHCFTLVVHRASPTRQAAPVAVAHLPTPSSTKNSALRFPLKIFTDSIGSVASLLFAAVSALLKWSVDWDKHMKDIEEIEEIGKRREEIANRKTEALDKIHKMLTEAIQKCDDINKGYAETAAKQDAMWSAFWRNFGD
jgi:hypothetical protein